jgi:hypothetical protein
MAARSARAASGRGFRLPLSKERVLCATVQLADEAGVASLPMRKLAETLGVLESRANPRSPAVGGSFIGFAARAQSAGEPAETGPTATARRPGSVSVLGRRHSR